jgi:Domain of unknown function (DUF5916)
VTVGGTLQSHGNPANPFERHSAIGRVGVDMKMGLGSNLTLEGSINPDFAQVEADPAEVNLSAFETFFQERRPFFIEGNELLQGGDPSYFYSRRIGSAPTGAVVSDYASRPDHSTILGAAKLTGRLSSGLSVGALVAASAREDARTFTATTGSFGQAPVAPATSFTVVRLRQQFGESGSTAGVVVTRVGRGFEQDDPLATFLPRQAYAAAADWNLRFRGGEYEFRGDVGVSYVSGTPSAIARVQRASSRYLQRPDQPHLHYDPARSALTGYRTITEFRRNSGRHLLWYVSAIVESPGFELNDIGRLLSVDQITVNGGLTYRETRTGRLFRNWSVEVAPGTFWTFGGDRDRVLTSVNVNTTWKDFSQTLWHFHNETRGVSASLTRGGPLMATPYFWDVLIRHTTNPAKRVSGTVYALYDENELGRHAIDLRPGLVIRPGSRWQLSVDPGYLRGTYPRQYITQLDGDRTETYGRRYVFSFVDRRELYTRFRLNYTFTPDISLETYVEPFASSGRYYRLGELERPRSNELRWYGTDGTTLTRQTDGSYIVGDGAASFVIANPDFTVRSLRSNVVLRWEWRPGSTLFVVWQQDRSERGTDSDPVNARALWNAFDAPGRSRLLVKATWWVPAG